MTVGELVGRCLARAGIERAWGRAPSPLGVVDVVPVGEEAIADLLADADGRTGDGPPGASITARGLLRLSSRPGGSAEPARVGSPWDLPEAVGEAVRVAGAPTPSTACLDLDLDLSAPVPPGCDSAEAASPAPATAAPGGAGAAVEELPEVLSSRVGGATAPMVFVGPGVVRGRAVGALRSLAAAARLGVANSWGAKGVFEWSSDHHLGTVGLQARDFELGGFADSDLIVASGIDPDESPAHRWALAPVLDLPVAAIPDVGVVANSAGRRVERPPLFERLAAFVQPLYGSEAFPMAPPRVISDLAAGMEPGDRLFCDAGLAGAWVARAFPTTEAGSVIVPATVAPGFAAAAALLAALRRDTRLGSSGSALAPPIAVTTSPLDATTEAVLELGRHLGVAMVVEAWGESGDIGSPGDHALALARARRTRGVQVIDVPVDGGFTETLVEVAGEIVAWGGSAATPRALGGWSDPRWT